MNHQTILLEDEDYDLNDDLPPELDFTNLRRDYERERRFRLQALERLPGNEARLRRFREQPAEAARLLRVALRDAALEPRILRLAVRAIVAARGDLNGLGLSLEETTAMVQLLAGLDEQLPQAA